MNGIKRNNKKSEAKKIDNSIAKKLGKVTTGFTLETSEIISEKEMESERVSDRESADHPTAGLKKSNKRVHHVSSRVSDMSDTQSLFLQRVKTRVGSPGPVKQIDAYSSHQYFVSNRFVEKIFD